MDDEWNKSLPLRRDLARILRAVSRAGFDPAGIASAALRLTGDRILVCAAPPDGGRAGPESACLYDSKRRNLGPENWPGTELDLHLALFRAYPGLGAVLHAQPPHATAFAAAGLVVNAAVTQETHLALGEVKSASYNPRGTCQATEAALQALGEYDSALLIRGLGALTIGKTPGDALRVMRLLETAARLTAITRGLGVETAGLTPAEQRAADEV